MNRIKLSLLFVVAAISLNNFGMQRDKEQPNTTECDTSNIRFSSDLNLEELLSGKKRVDAILWDFHGILGVADNEAKVKFASEKFPALGVATLDQLRVKYPEVANDTQKVILKGFIDIQKGALDANPALKADFDKIPKGALGEMYGAVFRKHGYRDIADLADGLSTTYKPRPGIEQVVRALAALGVKQYLGSNIAPHVYELVKRRFGTDHGNHMLDIIPVGAMVDISGYGPVPNSSIPQTKLVSQPKPSGEFFKAYRNYSENSAAITIFVDDKERNINEAIKHGPMIGILLDAKDPAFLAKLVASFNKLGIPVSK